MRRKIGLHLTHTIHPVIRWAAILAAAARIGFGINQALDSRYTSFSLYLSIAVIGLFAIVKHDRSLRAETRHFGGAILRLETTLLTAFAVSQGAPFWFDTLNRLVNIRSTGDPPPTTTQK